MKQGKYMEKNDLFGTIESFFIQPYGKSLIIKGKPGAGKTTFALGFLERVMEGTPVCYLSARFSDQSLFGTYPWLENVSLRNLAEKLPDSLGNVSTDSLRKLERMIEEGRTGNDSFGLILNISDLLPELKSIYSFVDVNQGNNPLIVIDSIESLSEKYDVDEQVLFSMLYSDLVEKSGANLICILEASENVKLEYFADGVLSMDYYLDNGILIRKALVEKLRGVSIGSSPVFFYSLADGKCSTFTRETAIYPEGKFDKVETLSKTLFEVPIDSSDLSMLTPDRSSNISLGSLIILHRVGNSPAVDEILNLVKNNLIRKAILQERGVMDVTSSSYETSRIMSNCAEPEALKHYITAEKSKKSNSYVINLEGKGILEDFPNEVIDFFMSSSSRPHLYFFSYDFMRFTYGENFFGDLINLVNSIRTTGAIFLIVDDESYGKISHYASFTIHFRDIGGYVFLNSTEKDAYISSVKYDSTKWPDVELKQVV
jgi:KaiC/GvpD/RAD55 family RecA-like ATPase